MITKFVIESNTDGSGVFEVVDIDDDYYVSPMHLVKKTSKLYDTAANASYAHLIQRLENGLDLEDYRSSANYDYFVNRLKIENPEYLI